MVPMMYLLEQGVLGCVLRDVCVCVGGGGGGLEREGYVRQNSASNIICINSARLANDIIILFTIRRCLKAIFGREN